MAKRVVFDAGRYQKTIKIRGAQTPYLPATAKVQMMFARFPDARLSLEILEDTDTYVKVKAIIDFPNGGRSEAIAREDKADFNDFLEKADIKAAARAAGRYGFDLDGPYDEFAEGYREVLDEDEIPPEVEDVIVDEQPEETPASPQIEEPIIVANSNDTVELDDTLQYTREWDFPITDFKYRKDKARLDEEGQETLRAMMHDAGFSTQGFLRYVYHTEEEAIATKKIKTGGPLALFTLADVPVSLAESVSEWLAEKE